MTSCCKSNDSKDLQFYRELSAVTRTLAANPDRFREDLGHHVKGPKLRELHTMISKIVDSAAGTE